MTVLRVSDARQARWLREAYKAAKASPSLGPRLEELEEKLAAARARQGAVIEHALDQRRTMHVSERSLYDEFEGPIHRLETDIIFLLERAYGPRPISTGPTWRLL